MKQQLKLSAFAVLVLILLFTSCTSNKEAETVNADSLEANIKMYTHTWDEIINHGRFDIFNDSNFTADVVMHANPDVVGIDSARAMYANYVYQPERCR